MMVCGICGSEHVPANCDVIQVESHILDRSIPSRARLTMPEDLELKTMADGTYDVVALFPFEKGTRFGPLVSKKLCSLLPSINFPLRIFCESGTDTFSEYYLDTTNEDECNWMMFVNAATNFQEQNIICYQDQEDIYYVTVKDICEGEALKVWYSPYYASKMRKDTWKPNKSDENHNVRENIQVEQLVKNKKDVAAREIWSCKFCGKAEKLLSEFALHLIQHYRVMNNRFCYLCDVQFARVKQYQEHMQHVHNTRLASQDTSTALQKSELTISDQLPKAASVGGPLLLSTLIGDSMDNTMLILTNSNGNQKDQKTRESIDNKFSIEGLNFNLDPTVSEGVKILDNFNFEMASNENEPYVCDICLDCFKDYKEFVSHKIAHWNKTESGECDKVSKHSKKSVQEVTIKKSAEQLGRCGDPLLLTVLPSDSIDNTALILDPNQIDLNGIQSQHSLFESDNLNLNVELMLPENAKELDNFNFEITPSENEQFVCDICLKTFKLLKALILHMDVHIGKHICFECNKVFARKESLNYHTCRTYYKFKCSLCEKLFSQEKSLNYHIKMVHSNSCKHCKKVFSSGDEHKDHKCLKKSPPKAHVCQVCSKTFSFKNNLFVHMKSHHETKESYTCPTCNSVLGSLKTYLKHRKIHEGAEYKCDICGKVFNRQDSLKSHKDNQHSEPMTVRCETCHKEFKSKKLLKLHQVLHQSTSFDCQHCSAVFRTQKYLKRHVKDSHPGNKDGQPIISNSDKQYPCPECNKKFKLRNSVRRHIKTFHLEYNLEYKNNKIRSFENKRHAIFSKQVEDLKRTIENMNFTTDELNQDNTIEILFNKSDIFTSDSNDRLVESLINTAVSENHLEDKEHHQDPMLSMPDLDLDHIGLGNDCKS